MFNSLNTISAYIHSNPDLADEVLHELADILRYSLDTGEQNSVSLQQEVAIIDKYLNIEKARFGDRLNVKVDIPTPLLNTQVPPLILQPIIENAIKHNAKQTALTISISVKKNDKTIVISISDNGSGFNDEVIKKGYGQGVGMKNLQQRMLQQPKGKVLLSNGTGDNSGATIILEMSI
jgi:LytS/YehU family sensor histidine kinase